MKYYVKTDAVAVDGIEAESMDAAAVQFASSEGIAGVTDVATLVEAIEAIDGAWLWIESDEGGDRVHAGNMP